MATNRTIESGIVGRNIWIGRHDPFYDMAEKTFSGDTLHILRFTVAEAELVVEMLQEEIARKKKPKRDAPKAAK